MQAEMRHDGSVDWRGLRPPARGVRCVVVLPVRNEARLLPRALQALAQQTAAPGLYEVLVLANNCTDATAERARAFAATCSACAVHVVSVAWPSAMAHVGRARRALLDEAARRVALSSPKQGVLLSTDGDSHVAPDWLATTLAAIDHGADAVGGRIVIDPDPALPADAHRLMQLDDLYRRWRTQLESLADPDRADPWPRHHQHFGASLAVTAEAYAAVGGMPLVPYLEDEALVQALRLHDRSLRHSPAVQVRTSARLDGRAEVGLSWQLRAWADQRAGIGSHLACPAVPQPDQELRLWRLRRLARDLWRDVQTAPAMNTATSALCQRWLDIALDTRQPAWADSASDEPDMEPDMEPARAWPNATRLMRDMRAAPTFGSLWADLEPALLGQMAGAVLPMDKALVRLRELCAAAAGSVPLVVSRGRRSAAVSDRRRSDQMF